MSRPFLGPLAAAAFLFAACSSTAVGPDATPSPSVTTRSAVPSAEQRVVYVSDDLAVFTVRADGTDRQNLIGDGRQRTGGGIQAQPLPGLSRQQRSNPLFTWPTWSPDGQRVALSSIPGPTGDSVSALVVIEPQSLTEQTVHETFPGLVNVVAPRTFHYAYWSPDGRRLMFIAPNRDGTALTLFESPPAGSPADSHPRSVLSDAPLYFSWSPDSRQALVHNRERLLLLRDNGSLEGLRRPSLSYRVPAFSPEGETIAYVSETGAGERLIVRDLTDGSERELLEVSTEVAFAWSPIDRDSLVVARRADPVSFDYDGLMLVDVHTGEHEEVYEGGLLAFYWSPDGRKLAIAATGPDRPLQWEVLDVATGVVTELASFAPSADFLTHLQFFDQFAPSHLVWSADSTAIVFAGAVIEGSRGRGPDQAWVLDVTGRRPPLSLAQAGLAFFVPTLRPAPSS